MSKIDRILIDEVVIHRRVANLAKRFEQDCRDNGVDTVTVVLILDGALLFAADFMRHLDMKIKVETINASSYYGGTQSTGEVKIDRVPVVLNQDILLIDDIFDTGLTMESVRKLLLEKGAASVTTCALLDKQVSEYKCDLVGFEIPDEFVVGYGLDYEGHYRNLPYVGVLDTDTTNDDTIEDGFGSVWSKVCPTCKERSMVVLRPGKAQCNNCG
jgi:hypoxanthine phosphoribosyltransferase